jgi:cyanophycinase
MASAHKSRKGTLIVIGGKEDKSGDMVILKNIAEKVGRHKLVLATIASQVPEEVWDDYKKIFKDLGVKNLEHFSITQHKEALDDANLEKFKDAHAVFFTGGDQLKITTKIGGTPVLESIHKIYKSGGLIIGTSAGAAIMGKTMLVGGEDGESHKVGNWMMSPGLGFVEDIIVDQHFAQRGRLGRLLGAIALNPSILGIGIDEDTAIVVHEGTFKVLGTNAVYVVDGHDVSDTNISQAAANQTMSMHNVRLHVMAHEERYNLKKRIILNGKSL